MRLNRGTFILLIALLAIIGGALFISSQQTNVATPTPTPDAEAGALLPIASASDVRRVEVRDTTTGQFIELTRTESGGWAIAGSNARQELPNDTIIEQNVSSLVTTEYTARFDSDVPADFGLTEPQYVLFVETAEAAYTLYVGSRAPTTPRYYVTLAEGIAQPVIPAEATPEATPELTPEVTFEAALPDPFFALPPVQVTRPGTFPLSGAQTVAVIPQTVIVTLTGWLTTPPYLPPTPTPAPTMTPEATAEATPELTPEATAEATPELTPEATAGS